MNDANTEPTEYDEAMGMICAALDDANFDGDEMVELLRDAADETMRRAREAMSAALASLWTKRRASQEEVNDDVASITERSVPVGAEDALAHLSFEELGRVYVAMTKGPS